MVDKLKILRINGNIDKNWKYLEKKEEIFPMGSE